MITQNSIYISEALQKDNWVKLIYGGSVSPDNSSEILNTSIVDGALVGGASLDAEKFVDIINSVNL